MDVLAVRGAVLQATERARQGKGPTLIEAKTYRWYGHSHSDPRAYRTRDEEAEWKKRDPIIVMKGNLEAVNMLTESEFDGLEQAVDKKLRIKRMLKDGYEVVEAPMPSLVTVSSEIGLPRLPGGMGLMMARKKQIPVWKAQDIGAEPSQLDNGGANND